MCPAEWLCLKQGYEIVVLVVLLQIGAKDITVNTDTTNRP